MEQLNLTLFVEINNYDFVFSVAKIDENNNFKKIYSIDVPIIGLDNNRIVDYEKINNIVKKNIYVIEQKLNFTFKEAVLILENFNPSFINLSGYKRLNGSQILKENITYIINTLKSYTNEIESKKKIIHIFNSSFNLDKKQIDNLPIGLHGDFYSHELSFVLINNNDYKDIKNIFANCNLKLKKILLRSFIEGAYLSDNNKNFENFFHIKINKCDSKMFYFENNSLKYEQNFNFGNDIVLKDISKVTSLKINTVETILNKIEFMDQYSEDAIIEDEFFADDSYRKIKKKLIYDIAIARIKEFSNLMLFKNINLKHYQKNPQVLFLHLDEKISFKSLKTIYKKAFHSNNIYDINFIKNLSNEKILEIGNKLVHYGWKKEAIPISSSKKSLIAKVFEAIFN